jgi:hypothetical protein
LKPKVILAYSVTGIDCDKLIFKKTDGIATGDVWFPFHESLISSPHPCRSLAAPAQMPVMMRVLTQHDESDSNPNDPVGL